MAVKQAQVVIPGSGRRTTVLITPETTASDVLKHVGVGSDYFLSPATGDRFFQPRDKLDGLVNDGDTLYANPWAKVGDPAVFTGILVAVGGGAISLGLGALLSRLLRTKGPDAPTPPSQASAPIFVPTTEVAPRPAGWRRSGDTYSGDYVVKGQRFKGRVSFRSAWDSQFKVCAPDDLIQTCGEHSRCFLRRRQSSTPGRTWFEVHFQQRPESVLAGIVAIERTLNHGRNAGGTIS